MDDPINVFDFAEFFEKFEAEAIDGMVKKEKRVDLATGCIRIGLQEKMKNDLTDAVGQRLSMVSGLVAFITGFTGPAVRIQFKPELVQEILSAAMINLQGTSS